MVELRAFAFIDQLQRQMAGYIGSTARGYYPIAGQAALFMEGSPRHRDQFHHRCDHEESQCATRRDGSGENLRDAGGACRLPGGCQGSR